MKIRKMLKSDRYINAASKKKKMLPGKTRGGFGIFPLFLFFVCFKKWKKKKSKGRYTNSEIVQEFCFSVCFVLGYVF